MPFARVEYQKLNNSPIRALIIEDPLGGSHLSHSLKSLSDTEVESCDAAENEVISKIHRFDPCVVFTEVFGHNYDAVALLQRMKRELMTPPATVFFSHVVYRNPLAKAFELGLQGYILSSCHVGEVARATEVVALGGLYFVPDASAHLLSLQESPPQKDVSVDKLSNREMEVMKLLAEGLSNKEIAERLFISVRTVESHRARVMSKLNLKNYCQLVHYAIKNCLVE